MSEREDFTLLVGEWLALGGTPPAEDYDPTEEKRVYPAVKFMGEYQIHKTGLVPSMDNVLPVWEDVAERTGVRMLSIRWPDAHYPDFSAERIE